jgi:hypothetical protein
MCRCANSSNHGVSLSPRVPYRLLTILLASAVIVAAGCGGGKGPKNRISGKVTMGGQPVKGRVIFFGSDGKEKDSGLGAGGAYEILDPPLGEVTIVVKGYDRPAGAGEELKPTIPKTKDKAKLDGPGSVGTQDEGGVNPPAKYGKKDTSPLKHTVKGGSKEEHNITLEK